MYLRAATIFSQDFLKQRHKPVALHSFPVQVVPAVIGAFPVLPPGWRVPADVQDRPWREAAVHVDWWAAARSDFLHDDNNIMAPERIVDHYIDWRQKCHMYTQ